MRRRAFLAALSGVVAGLAGCLGQGGPGDDSSATTSLSRSTTSTPAPPATATPRQGSTSPRSPTATPRTSEDLQFDLRMQPPDYATTDAGPTITFEAGATRVLVAGTMRYGSSSCDEIAVTDLRWAAGGTVQVAVESQTKPTETGTCTADIATAEYELTISTGGVPIEKLLVVEIPYDGEARERTATPA
jgi:hypothetical protein